MKAQRLGLVGMPVRDGPCPSCYTPSFYWHSPFLSPSELDPLRAFTLPGLPLSTEPLSQGPSAYHLHPLSCYIVFTVLSARKYNIVYCCLSLFH